MGPLFGQDGRQFPGTLDVTDGLERIDPGRVPEDRAWTGYEVIGQALKRRGAKFGHLAPEPAERTADAPAAQITCGIVAVAGGDRFEDEVVTVLGHGQFAVDDRNGQLELFVLRRPSPVSDLAAKPSP